MDCQDTGKVMEPPMMKPAPMECGSEDNMGPQAPIAREPVARYKQLLGASKFLFVIYSRGHWCPFCRAYLTSLQSLSKSISAAGGKILMITSEPENFLTETRELSGYTGEAIVDTQHSLAQYFKEKGVLNVAITEKKGYEHGMAQPAMLVIKSDGTVLESWAIVPSTMNLGGARDRPDINQVWENAQALLEGKRKVHATYKLQNFFKIAKAHLFG